MGMRAKPEEVIAKLREIEIRLARGETAAAAARAVGVTEQSYYRWRKEYGGLQTNQVKRLKEIEKENQRLRRAVSDLTLDNQILQEVVRRKYSALHASGLRSIMWWKSLAYNSAGLDVLDASAFGDNVDIDTGALSFQHTDVSLPDNSGLPVTISRRFGRDTIDGAGPGIGSWITMTFSTRNGRTVSSTTFRLNRKTGRPQRIPSK